MEAHTFLLQLLVILVAARVCGELVASLGAPSVIGELLAGILIGPSLFGWVAPSELLRVLAEVGVILLLFEVGLETDMDRLLGSARKSVTVAMGGFLAPLVVGWHLLPRALPNEERGPGHYNPFQFRVRPIQWA